LTQPTTELVVCLCETCCVSGTTTPRRTSSFGPTGEPGFSSTEYVDFNTSNSCMPQQQQQHLVSPRSTEQQHNTPLIQNAIRFMPPAPPRLDTCDVLFACGADNADTIVYMMMTRWYTKVCQIQHFFVSDEAHCPEPRPDGYSFGEWCQLANDWWKKNFAHLQKKAAVSPTTSPTSFSAPSNTRYSQQQTSQHHHRGGGGRRPNYHNGWW